MKKIYFIILFFISFVTCNNLTQTSDQPIDEFEKDNNQNIDFSAILWYNYMCWKVV